MSELTKNIKTKENLDKAIIRFAGDSGDGIQLIGSEFTNTTALAMNDLGTLPDFPAEIRAPIGTVAGVSGFQIQFSSQTVYTPGDLCDVLVVMNAAALKKNLTYLKDGGTIIANEEGFDSKNLRLANINEIDNPLTNNSLSGYNLIKIPVNKIIKESLSNLKLGNKDIDRSKNMFVLGLLYWIYNRNLSSTVGFIEAKFKKLPDIAQANIQVLQAGYNFGETSESFQTQYEVKPASLPKGKYRNITGNVATALGMIAFSDKSNLKLFYGSYPITPASDILHELAKCKNFGVITFQAEDEIAAVTSALGASYGGLLGCTASSGPGIDLKSEALGLAVMLELPLLVIDVQRAGPSTGMPTKTEQADLMLAMFGRHGEAPMPIIAAKSPSDCFTAVYEAMQIAVEFMTPVFFLSDGYIANGSEPWNVPDVHILPKLDVQFAKNNPETKYQPYQRNEKLVREWAIPGTSGLENRIGGIEKEDITGNISYEPDNHEKMVHLRAKKIENIAQQIPPISIEIGNTSGDILIMGWGGTYGVLKSASKELFDEGYNIGFCHLRWMNPFPKNLQEVFSHYKKIIVPEINNRQLSILLKANFKGDFIAYNRIKGLPFQVQEIKEIVKNELSR